MNQTVKPELKSPKMKIPTSQLMIGNTLKYKGTEYLATVDLIHGKKHFDCRDEFGSFTPNGEYEPIPLTPELLDDLGFETYPHMTVMNSKFLKLGRNRQLSVGCVGTPNEMVFLQEVADDGMKINDLICLRNFDYDGKTYVHHLQNICAVFGVEAGYMKLREGGEQDE